METTRRDRWIEWMECIDATIDKIRALDIPNSKKGELFDLLFIRLPKKSSND